MHWIRRMGREDIEESKRLAEVEDLESLREMAVECHQTDERYGRRLIPLSCLAPLAGAIALYAIGSRTPTAAMLAISSFFIPIAVVMRARKELRQSYIVGLAYRLREQRDNEAAQVAPSEE